MLFFYLNTSIMVIIIFIMYEALSKYMVHNFNFISKNYEISFSIQRMASNYALICKSNADMQRVSYVYRNTLTSIAFLMKFG